MTKPPLKFRPDLTTRERIELRQQIKDRAIERATREAARAHVSQTCFMKPVEEHTTCIGRTGCLCTCHDIQATVISRRDHR